MKTTQYAPLFEISAMSALFSQRVLWTLQRLSPSALCRSLYRLPMALALMICCNSLVTAAPLILSKTGQSSLEWLLIEHAKEGGIGDKSCIDCHENGLFSFNKDAQTEVDLNVRVEKGHLIVELRLTYLGKVSHRNAISSPTLDVAFLLGTPKEKLFDRVGCWAACHSDMKSMEYDAGYGKYLASTRKRILREGGGEEIRSKSDLKMLRFQNRFLEMWRIRILAGKVHTLWQEDLLEQSQRINMGTLQAETYSDESGYFTVSIKRPLKVARNMIHFKSGTEYTMGVAILDEDPRSPTIEISVPKAEADAEKSTESEPKSVSEDQKSPSEQGGEEVAEDAAQQEKADGAEMADADSPPAQIEEVVEEDKMLVLKPTEGPVHWVSFPIKFTP